MRRPFLCSFCVAFVLLILGTGCQEAGIRSKEAVLRKELKTMRDQIGNYATDREKRPQSLQDLVDAGYMREIPKDPFTDSASTWQVKTSGSRLMLDETNQGISDVHSGSNLTGSDGTPYSSW